MPGLLKFEIQGFRRKRLGTCREQEPIRQEVQRPTSRALVGGTSNYSGDLLLVNHDFWLDKPLFLATVDH